MHLAAPDERRIGQAWLDAAPYVREKLRRGALHADVGCGSGRGWWRWRELLEVRP